MVLDEFLGRPELDRLVDWVCGHAPEFAASGVVTEGGSGGVDRTHRRSKVLYDAGPVRALFEDRLMSVLDHVRRGLGKPEFPVSHIEMQVTASNDGEYFRTHTDNGHDLLGGRELTYVYFFHREPARFSGGRLRLFQPGQRGGQPVSGPVLAEIVPQQNQVVFFLPLLFHEVETISCPSGRFRDSRFTVNGWYRSS